MKQVKTGIPNNLQRGIPLKVRPGHTSRLEVTDEPLTVHTGLSLFYTMAETLEILRILDQQVKVKERESGHIVVLAANAFIGGDYLDDPEAQRENVAISLLRMAGALYIASPAASVSPPALPSTVS